MKKLNGVFLRIKRHKQLLIVLLIFVFILFITINYFVQSEIINFKNTLDIILLILFGILVAESMIRLIIGFNLGLNPFSNFLQYVYKQKAADFFPNQGIFPDFQYYWYHPFYHFALKPSIILNQDTIEINSLGFRGKENTQNELERYNIYLSGDCQFFEQHLKEIDTFAVKLERNLANKKVAVNNAAGPHYTMLHCLNRMIIDQNKLNIHLAILGAGINDVIVFLHSRDGKVPPDYTNFYKSFSEDRILKGFHDLWLVRNLKIVQLYKFLRIREWLMFDHSVESCGVDFSTAENAEKARRIFFTDYFENYLKKYISICKSFNIPLMLMTPKYNPADMVKPAQRFIAYGIEQIILVQKKLAEEFNIPIVDCQKELTPTADTMFNKWHLTGAGNEQRAKLASDFIERYFFEKTL